MTATSSDISVQFNAGSPFRKSLLSLINEYKTIRVPEVDRKTIGALTTYTINAVNMDNDVSLYFRHKKTFEITDSVPYSDIAYYDLMAATEYYTLMRVPRYTMKTIESDNIFVFKPEYRHYDEMWPLENNGTICFSLWLRKFKPLRNFSYLSLQPRHLMRCSAPICNSGWRESKIY